MPPKPAPLDSPLRVSLERGELVVRIGIRTLAHAVTYSEWANPYNEDANNYLRSFAIVDIQQFAKDVRHEMLSEREDGSTPLSDFLDKVTKEAVEQGSEGLHENEQRIPFGQMAEVEKW